ncbi:MAG: hypothetical protein K2P99_05305 [Burkholderiales bacterium]|nr:hypothetical protein [Burkholderiales bacterium]
MDIKNIANPDDIKSESLDFIYQNAVAYLEAIHKSMESISNRSLVLLSYLMIVVGFTSTHVVSRIISLFAETSYSFNQVVVIILGILLVLYYIWIIWDIVHYSKPRWANIAYSQPNDILGEELNLYGIHMIKFVRCIELQNDIAEDIIIMTNMFKQFEGVIDRAFILPKLIKFIKLTFYFFRH